MKRGAVIFLSIIGCIAANAQEYVEYGDSCYMFQCRQPVCVKDSGCEPLPNYAYLGYYYQENNRVVVSYKYDYWGYCSRYIASDTTLVYGIAVTCDYPEDSSKYPYVKIFKKNDTIPPHNDVYVMDVIDSVEHRLVDTATLMLEKQFIYEGNMRLYRDSSFCPYNGEYLDRTYPDSPIYVFLGDTIRDTVSCHEYYFKTPVSVIDTFYVASMYARPNRPDSTIKWYGSPFRYIEKSQCPEDNMLGGRVQDNQHFEVNIPCVWGGAFPIIVPYQEPNSDSLGVRVIGVEPEVYVAPNPATGSTTLTTDVPVNRLLMYNVDGRLVRELSPNATRVEINLAGLPKGLYIISAVTPQGTAHRKLIVR